MPWNLIIYNLDIKYKLSHIKKKQKKNQQQKQKKQNKTFEALLIRKLTG